MADFPEGAHWHTYGKHGFAEANSLTLRNGDGLELTGIFKESHGYLALNVQTGSLLTERLVEFNDAIEVAESEAIAGTNS